MNNIVLEDQFALEEHERLLEVGKEFPVALRERNAEGKTKSTLLKFGMGGGVAWVFCTEETEGADTRTALEEVLVHEAPELFGGYLDRMRLRQCLVDPSPLSAELVEIDPCIKDVIADLEAKLGIRVEA